MPTRIFNVLDAINHVFSVDPAGVVSDGVTSGTQVPLSTILVSTGVGSWEMNPNLNGTGNPAACSIVNFFPIPDEINAVTQTWDVDYENFPAIPDGAKVKKLTFRRPRSVNYTFTDNDIDDEDNNMSFLTYEDDILTPIFFASVSDSGYASPKIVNEVFAGEDADEILFDHTGTEDFVTKEDLIADWSSFNNNIPGMSIFVSLPLGGATTALSGSMSVGNGWTVTVEYEEGFDWEVSPQGRTVQPGTEITATSSGPDALDFELIETITAQPKNGDGDPIGPPIEIDPTTITNNLLIFRMPDFATNPLPLFVSIIITSSQFTGEMELQLYQTIYIYNAPGIYKLVPGQRHDTLYDRTDEEDVTTINTKIPDPFIKTGMING